jgi:endoglucanase
VLSIHQYGPDVRHTYVKDWYDNALFIQDTPELGHWHQTPVVTGEWGGWAEPGTGDDNYWREVTEDFHARNVSDTGTFWWCLSPDSGDTGGLVQNDFSGVVQHKVDLISAVHPNPTVVG